MKTLKLINVRILQLSTKKKQFVKIYKKNYNFYFEIQNVKKIPVLIQEVFEI